MKDERRDKSILKDSSINRNSQKRHIAIIQSIDIRFNKN